MSQVIKITAVDIMTLPDGFSLGSMADKYIMIRDDIKMSPEDFETLMTEQKKELTRRDTRPVFQFLISDNKYEWDVTGHYDHGYFDESTKEFSRITIMTNKPIIKKHKTK